MSWVSLCFVLFLSVSALQLHAAEIYTDQNVVLEFPRGRFQESSTPTYFRWTNIQTVETLTLKVFRTDSSGKFNESTDLLARYDYSGKVQSMNWTQGGFAIGHYLWLIEGFNNTNPKPLFSRSAQFTVEELQQYDMQATRMGLLVGFSRGTFKSLDPIFEIEYDTTPTRYGLSLRGGESTTGWDINAYGSDFVLRGGVQQTVALNGAHYWRFYGANPYSFQMFAGPSLRLFQFPLVRTSDGENITEKSVMSYNTGATLYMRRQLSSHLTLFSQIHLDVSVAGSKDVPEMDQLSTRISAGSLFSLFWPFGLSGEMQYSSEKYKMRDGTDDVEIQIAEWAIIGNLVYSF